MFSQYVAENSSLLGCYTVSLGTCFPTFREKALPSPSKPDWSVNLEDGSDRSIRNVFTFHVRQSLLCGMPLCHLWIMKVNFGFCRGWGGGITICVTCPWGEGNVLCEVDEHNKFQLHERDSKRMIFLLQMFNFLCAIISIIGNNVIYFCTLYPYIIF
jgi:hypothetical protein